MTKNTKQIIELLDEHYGRELVCYLEYSNPWQLLFATIMSAQCTDERVNMVTRRLFKDYPTLEAFANATQEEMEKAIHSTGFYHHKAENIIACARVLLEKYEGRVPDTIEELTALPGVGRKTANVILGNIYHKQSIVVDTHVKRVSKRLGLTKEEDPTKVEYDLMKALPKEHWILWNLQIIAHGRGPCNARKPECETCFLKDCCKQEGVKPDRS